MNSQLEKILLVEDEPDIREVAALALEEVGGLGLETCSSGQEAMEIVSTYNPDLLLIDVMMPGMDGPTVFQQIKKIPGMESIPAIFMTAKVQPQEIAHYKDMGALDVIAKPFDPMLLADTIRKIWEGHDK